jgi:ribosome biogenesis GTPase / thiamine phosphate phosphatase
MPWGPLPRGVIEEIARRRSALRRACDHGRAHVLCANVDQITLVVAAFDPPYQRSFIDRLLVGIERNGLPALIVVNKIDLAGDEGRDAIARDLAVYQAVGYRALLISAATGEGPTR